MKPVISILSFFAFLIPNLYMVAVGNSYHLQPEVAKIVPILPNKNITFTICLTRMQHLFEGCCSSWTIYRNPRNSSFEWKSIKIIFENVRISSILPQVNDIIIQLGEIALVWTTTTPSITRKIRRFFIGQGAFVASTFAN